MTPPVWQGTCAHCRASFPLAEAEAHAQACEATSRERLKLGVERPQAWAFGIATIREMPVEPVPGVRQRRFELRVTENPMSRGQLIGLRDLLTLVLEEAPEPVVAEPPRVPMHHPPASVTHP